MPTFERVSHVSFSARDADGCADWLIRTLDFRVIDRVQGATWRGVLLLHRPSGTILEFQQHDGNAGEPFDPRRTGLDHVGFKCADRDALIEWQEHFRALGVDHTPVVDREYGSVLSFRDPDGRQFEMFYKVDHP